MGRLSDLDAPQLLLLGVVVATVLAAGVAASTSASAFGAYNPSWEGASDLRGVASEAGAEATVVTDTADYGDANSDETVAFVLSPDEAYGADDTERVRRFVRSGGTLVVAEDFGPHANPLLADLGVGVRFDGRLLRDERRHYRSPNLTVATNVSDHPLTAGVDRLTLNHGTALRSNDSAAPDGSTAPGNDATVLVDSSSYAYLDANRNAALDESEAMGARPVAAVERVGEGRVVAVSDPSLFINAMLDRRGNRQFVSNLVSGRDAALLDYSHARSIPPLAAATLALRGSPLLQALSGLVGVAAVAVGASRANRIRAALARAIGAESGARGGGADARPDPERLARAVRERHPDWSQERVDRIVAGIIYTGEKGKRDD